MRLGYHVPLPGPFNLHGNVGGRRRRRSSGSGEWPTFSEAQINKGAVRANRLLIVFVALVLWQPIAMAFAAMLVFDLIRSICLRSLKMTVTVTVALVVKSWLSKFWSWR